MNWISVVLSLCQVFTNPVTYYLLHIVLWLVAARVAETKVHKILGKEVTVELNKPITVQKAAMVTGHEQAAILVNNVADTISYDLLYLYIDNITELEGKSGDYTITRCDGLQVIITFINQPAGGMYIFT